jgi:hypothetical protein
MLKQTRVELAAGAELLADVKKRAKKAKRKTQRDDAKRTADLIERTLKSIESHKNLLVAKTKAKDKRARRAS